jgi:lipopolysaccharide export system protein LptC
VRLRSDGAEAWWRGAPVQGRRRRRIVRSLAIAAVAAGLAFARAVADESEGVVITEFDVPEYNEEGTMTSRIRGDTARVMTNGFVQVNGLTMEFYKEGSTNRDVEMRVASPRCLLHRDKKAAVSDSDVRIARDNMVVTGTGFMWNNNDQKLVILTNSRVVIKGARRNMNTEEERP